MINILLDWLNINVSALTIISSLLNPIPLDAFSMFKLISFDMLISIIVGSDLDI